MIASVARRYTFHASHEAEGLPEPWNTRHEHDYTIEVVARGEGPVVVETDDLDNVWNFLRAACEDQHLNYTLGGPTTVEDLATRIFRTFADNVPAVAKVTVWEDDSRWGSAER